MIYICLFFFLEILFCKNLKVICPCSENKNKERGNFSFMQIENACRCQKLSKIDSKYHLTGFIQKRVKVNKEGNNENKTEDTKLSLIQFGKSSR